MVFLLYAVVIFFCNLWFLVTNKKYIQKIIIIVIRNLNGANMQYWRISNWLLELKKSIDCKSTWCFARFTTWSSIGLIQEKIYNSLWINKSMWCYSGFSIWSRIYILTDCSEGSNKGIDKISISFWCSNNFVSNLVPHSNQSQEKDLVQQPALIHSFTNEYRSCISTWCL